jgi:vacuolar-type H+-ATPase subunit I/STV1
MTVLPWVLLGIPLASAIAGFVKLRSRSPVGGEQPVPLPLIACALSLAIGASLLGIGALTYVQLVRPIDSRNYTVESLGLLLSLAGLVCVLSSRGSGRREIAGLLAFGATLWLCFLYFMMASTY